MVFKNILPLNNFNLSIFKKTHQIHVYVYNSNYYVIIKISTKTKFHLNKDNCISLSYDKPSPNIDLYSIKMFLKQLYLCDFAKIKFTGKGYKIKKNNPQSVVLLFNRAHTTVIWWRSLFLKKLKKYKIYIKYTNKNKNIVNTLVNIRSVNIFTKKGLRRSRQILLKKKGKK